MEDSEQAYEFVIVGFGISGSSLAAVLARAGRDVLLLEKTETLDDWSDGGNPSRASHSNQSSLRTFLPIWSVPKRCRRPRTAPRIALICSGQHDDGGRVGAK
ncbi:MAG: NAD(P)-binding protein [Rhizomicrobium sp.]|jgi:choline dehydrogenase-like flavoprotein